MRISANHPLRRLFSDLVARELRDDRAVAGYVASILIDFVHVDHLYRIRNARGKRLEEVGEMLVESDPLSNTGSFERERAVRKHIGDYTLFLTGIFPEYVAALPRRGLRLDGMIDYVKAGKESYRIVAAFDQFEYCDVAPLFRRLAEEFEYCVYGLNRVKSNLESLRQEQYHRGDETCWESSAAARDHCGAMCYVLYELNRILPAILACVAVMTCGIDLSAGEGWIRIGPFGGGAEIVRVSASMPDTVLAATRAGIIFKSIDRGAHWEVAAEAPGPGCVIHALAIHPLRDDTWLSGFDCEAAALSGLYETADGGKTWSAIPELRGQTAWSVAFSNDGDKIAAGMSDGVYLNYGGEGWSRISPVSNTDLKPVVSLNFDRQNEDVLYAGTTHLPWRTKDRGKTWESIHSGMLDDSDVFSIEPDPRKPTRVYASACSGAYISENQGANWSRLPTPHGAYRAYFVALDPHTPEMLFVATSAGLFRSSDNGHTWRKLSADIVKSVAFDRSRKGVIYFASQSTGVLSTNDDGDTLHHNADGFSNQNFCGLAATNGRVYAAVREGTGCQLLENSDTGWRPVVTPAPIKALAATGKALYIASGRRVLRSRDSGRTWTELAKAAVDSMSALGGSELEISPDGTVAKLTGDNAMFSVDGGTKWSPCRPAKPDLVWYGLAMHGGHDVFGFAATSRGLFRVDGNCATWSTIDGGLSLGTVSLIYPHPTNADVFAAAQEGRVFLTFDAGGQWRRLSDQGRHGMFPTALAIDPTVPNRIYALFPGLGVAYQDFFAEAARATRNGEVSQH